MTMAGERWTFNTRRSDTYDYIEDAEGELLAHCLDDSKGPLMAAAPELLEACKIALDTLTLPNLPVDAVLTARTAILQTGNGNIERQLAMDALRAAISKAEGREDG